ncbi:MAG: hypothetical protein ABSH47_04415 [Bryobacteraceae bacterium]
MAVCARSERHHPWRYLLVRLGQTARQVPIPADHPELYFSYFTLLERIRGEIADNRDKPEKVALVQRAAASRFNMDERDLDRSRAVAHAVLARVASLNSESESYLRSQIAARLQLDRSTLQSFEQRRMAIIQDGVRELRARLSAGGWTSLRAYVNGELRAHVVRVELSNEEK